MVRIMWLSAFCATLIFAGFGCQPREGAEPEAPLSVYGNVHGSGQSGILVVQVVAQADAPHALVELALPDGVAVVGVPGKAEADVTTGSPHYFRFPLKASKPGAYIIGIKVMGGEESYRFGKSISVAWIAQSD